MDLGLYHNSHEFYCRSVFGAAPSGSQVVLRLRADKNIEENWQASVRLWQSNAGETIVPMTWEGDAFKATLTMPDKGCLLWYYFIVSYDGKTVYYGNNHEQLGGKGRITAQEPPSYQITVYDKAVKTPDWFKNAIVYQIFPDRFRRGKDTTAVLTGKKGPSSTAIGTIYRPIGRTPIRERLPFMIFTAETWRASGKSFPI